MLDSRERFAATAEQYDRFRPSYPEALLGWIVETTGLGPGDPVADIGCGTGISTRLFGTRGYQVVGIDPSEAMLALARARGGASYRRGEAAATGLPESSVKLVVAAQSFHWFEIPATLSEWRRILRPRGWCAAFWNVRGRSAFLREYDRLLRKLSAEYAVLGKPAETLAALQARPELCDQHAAEFRQVQVLDRAGLFGRAYSSSYVVHGVMDWEAFDRSLDRLFERWQSGGRLRFHYRTRALCFRIGDAPTFSP